MFQNLINKNGDLMGYFFGISEYQWGGNGRLLGVQVEIMGYLIYDIMVTAMEML